MAGGGYSNNVQVADFNLPDLRGLFLRGWNGSRDDEYKDTDLKNRVALFSGGQPWNNVGSYQLDELKSHTHDVKFRAIGGSAFIAGEAHAVDSLGTTSTTATTGTETRPKNAYVQYIIKY